MRAMLKAEKTPERSYRKVLIDELEVRTRRNPSYSLRAFARDLGLSHSSLSRVLMGTQGLSHQKAVAVSKALKLNPSDAPLFEALVQAECSRSEKVRAVAKEKIRESEKKVSEFSLQYFRVVADWYHFAIAELTTVAGFKSDPLWIAKRLGITPIEAKEAIARLAKLELIEKNSKGEWIKTADFRMVNAGVPDRSIKSYHQQILKKAETALFEQDYSERNFSGTSFAMSSETFEWAKEEMKKFRHAFTRRLAQEENKDRLYALSMQLFALDQPEGKKGK